MLQQLILSVLSDDKPGVVRAVANVVSLHEGNWQESHLSRLGGKFAGVISIEVDSDRRPGLEQSVGQLATQGIRVVVDEQIQPDAAVGQVVACFSAAAPDRKGIVLEFSQALADQGINVLELETQRTSVPYSGEPLFSATGIVALPPALSLDAANEQLAVAVAELGMDFILTGEPQLDGMKTR